MPSIATFVYSENTQNQDNKLCIVGPLVVFKPPVIPSMYSFSMTFGIIDMDIKIDHTIQIVFVDPDNSIVFDTKVINMPRQSEEIGNNNSDVIASVDCRNALLKLEGTYTSKVFLDGELMGIYPIQTKKGD